MKILGAFVILVLFVGGIVFASWLNVTWMIELVVSFINHIKETPIDSAAVAIDVVKFMFRGVVFAVTIVVCQLPTFLVSILLSKIRD